MKYILLTIFTMFFSLSSILAQEDQITEQITVKLSFFDILFAISAPLVFLLIAYLLIKKFKL